MEGTAVAEKAAGAIEQFINSAACSENRVRAITSRIEDMADSIAGTQPPNQESEPDKAVNGHLLQKLSDVDDGLRFAVDALERAITRLEETGLL